MADNELSYKNLKRINLAPGAEFEVFTVKDGYVHTSSPDFSPLRLLNMVIVKRYRVDKYFMPQLIEVKDCPWHEWESMVKWHSRGDGNE